MARQVSFLIACAMFIGGIAFVWKDTFNWQRAAQVADAGLRPMGSLAVSEHPGAIFVEPDSYLWLSYARRIAQGETFRVRRTDGDNAPYGRPMHWSQSISWLLVGCGKIRQLATHENWNTAMERAAVWLNPALLVGLCAGLAWPLFRRVGGIPAALFVVYLVSLGDVNWEFHPLRPDHQSLQALFGVFLLAGLVFGGAGWVRTHPESNGEPNPAARPLEVPEFRDARRWFLLSGACAGLSLWISALVAFMLLGMLFCAGLLLAWRAPELTKASNVSVRPELWRWWGWAGGAVSFLFYLIEYFPGHLEFRLEINGPLYSVAVVAMGEGISQFLRARYAPPGRGRAPLLRGLLCLLIVIVVPLAILFGPIGWHAVRDPEMWRLHNFIQEFYSMPRFAGPRLWTIVVNNFGILPLFLVLAIALAAFATLRLQEWTVLWLSFVVTLGLLGLGYMQVRWLGLYVTMNAWLAVVAGVSAWQQLSRRLPKRIHFIIGTIVVALLLIQPLFFCQRRIKQTRDIIEQRSLITELANPIMNKQLALGFRKLEGDSKRVMADPNIVPALNYFGASSGVVSFYWENVDGLHAATRFFADSNGEGARQVAAERGLTHVIVQEGNRLQNYFYFFATGKIDEEAARNTFVAQLMGSEFRLPPWLETVPALQQVGFQIYNYAGSRFEDRWRIYRIQLN